MKLGEKIRLSRTQYEAMLEDAIGNDDFYIQIAMLLHDNPYFFPGYLEMIWAADERHDREAIIELELAAYRAAAKLLRSKELISEIISVEWRELEKQALCDVLELMCENKSITYSKRFYAYTMRVLLSRLINLKSISSPREQRRLRLVEKFDVAPYKSQLDKLPYFWWQINNTRAQNISHHQHTRTILLRTTPNRTEEYVAHDGVHESLPTPYVAVLSSVHDLVLDFAKRHNYALGRVAVVKMRPRSQSYRDFDSEVYLRGRDRFHLVLQAGGGNMLSSGVESVEAKPGELWFFDNSVMHRAHNQADQERIHVIFDGYPLEPKS